MAWRVGGGSEAGRRLEREEEIEREREGERTRQLECVAG